MTLRPSSSPLLLQSSTESNRRPLPPVSGRCAQQVRGEAEVALQRILRGEAGAPADGEGRGASGG